ncbi:hypothetical protein ACQ5SK_41600 [Bradyrhizobium japonicum]
MLPAIVRMAAAIDRVFLFIGDAPEWKVRSTFKRVLLHCDMHCCIATTHPLHGNMFNAHKRLVEALPNAA